MAAKDLKVMCYWAKLIFDRLVFRLVVIFFCRLYKCVVHKRTFWTGPPQAPSTAIFGFDRLSRLTGWRTESNSSQLSSTCFLVPSEMHTNNR